jgi:hypothetical protein
MKNRWKPILIAVIVLVLLAGVLVWSKLYRVVAQPKWIAGDQRTTYFYGSVEAGKPTGIPYWIWLAMPRIFPEHMPGTGGYASLGVSWEEGREMPVGFAKQRVGYIRVTGNCALCHVISQSSGSDQPPLIVAAIPGRTTDLKPLLTFLRECAADSRFNADEFFAEIDSDTKITFLDRLLYRYVLIPRTRKALIADPAQVLFSPALRAHISDPHSSEPFSDPSMRAPRDIVIQQSQPVQKQFSTNP